MAGLLTEWDLRLNSMQIGEYMALPIEANCECEMECTCGLEQEDPR